MCNLNVCKGQCLSTFFGWGRAGNAIKCNESEWDRKVDHGNRTLTHKAIQQIVISGKNFMITLRHLVGKRENMWRKGCCWKWISIGDNGWTHTHTCRVEQREWGEK